MTKKPLISIVTPCYNTGRFLEECIQSVLEQDYPHVEHIIQDGASTDNTLSILTKYGKKFPNRIKWESKPDKGQSDGLNKALQKSKGDIILVLNADDALLPYACKLAVENLNKYPKSAVVYFDMYVMDEDSNVKNIIIHPEYSYKKFLCLELIPPAQAAFIRRSMFEKVGFRADRLLDTCPDFEIFARIGYRFPMQHVHWIVTKYRVFKKPPLDSKRERTVARFVASKKEVMDRLFDSKKTRKEIRKLRFRAYSGLYRWASIVARSFNQPSVEIRYIILSFAFNLDLRSFIKVKILKS